MRRALAAAALCALLAGCERREPKEDGDDVLAPRPATAYPPELQRLFPMDPRWWIPSDRVMPFVVAWSGGYTTRFLRTVDGWDGDEARVSYRFFHGKRPMTSVVEWYRVGEGPSLVISRRQVGLRTHVIEPPMRWLVAPLAEGQTWTWEGTIDGTPATDVATVRAVAHWRGHDGLIALEHVAKLGSREVKRVSFFAPGLGVIGEEAGFSDEGGVGEQVWIPQ